MLIVTLRNKTTDLTKDYIALDGYVYNTDTFRVKDCQTNQEQRVSLDEYEIVAYNTLLLG